MLLAGRAACAGRGEETAAGWRGRDGRHGHGCGGRRRWCSGRGGCGRRRSWRGLDGSFRGSGGCLGGERGVGGEGLLDELVGHLFVADERNDRAHGHHVAGLIEELLHGARNVGLDLEGRLVGGDVEERLALFYRVAFAAMPGFDGGFLDRLAELGHPHFFEHRGSSAVRRGSPCRRSEMRCRGKRAGRWRRG